MDSRDHYVLRFESETAPGDPAWLQLRRKEAMARFAEAGFPTVAEEDWRYTNLAKLAQVPFELAAPGSHGVLRDDIERLAFPVFACSVFVFVNGAFVPELSAGDAPARGLHIGSLAAALEADPAGVESQLGTLASHKDEPLVALNTAFLRDGAILHVPADTVVEAPIHLVYVSAPRGASTISHPRTLVVAGRGSRVTVIEDFVSLGAGSAFTNAVTEVVLEDGAFVEHVSLQREHEDTAHVATVRARVGRDARYLSHAISLGSTLTRNDLRATLDGVGADCELNGFYVASGRQHVDNHTTVDHAQPHGTSREFYKGVLDGAARGVFAGRVIVRPDAQKTSAQQTNKNLLLSADAEINSKPQLEIYADDVKCSHGSTIGQLDDDALFFLRARGLDSATARALLMRAFASEITARIHIAALRERIDELLLQRLSRAGSEPKS